MDDLERDRFDQQWRDAFSRAEAEPAEQVWSTIELKLENKKMKRRVFYYQRLAAALVIFVLALAAITTGIFTDDNKVDRLAEQNLPAVGDSADRAVNSKSEEAIAQERVETPHSPDERSVQSLSQKKEDVDAANNAVQLTQGNMVAKTINKAKTQPTGKPEVASDTRSGAEGTGLEPLNSNITYPSRYHSYAWQRPMPVIINSVLQNNLSVQPDNSLHSWSILPGQEVVYQSPKRDTRESFWLGVGGNAGNYNPGTIATVSSAALLNSADITGAQALTVPPQSEPATSGAAFAFGLSIGKRIGKRWMLQSGVTYLTQSLNYNSNIQGYLDANSSTALVAEFADTGTPIIVTQPYTVTNSLEFVSVPLQVGYILIDQKASLQLNVGMASDFFLRNTLRDQSGQTEKFSQSSGSDSPYRAVNWTGLANTELSYKIANRYQISFVPGIRYTLQPALKESDNSSGTPVILDLGFRFRYLFP